MPIGTYTPPPPPCKSLHKKIFTIFFFFHFRCILLQISHKKKCFFINIAILGRSGVKVQINKNKLFYDNLICFGHYLNTNTRL